jgi:hypothetical protein
VIQAFIDDSSNGDVFLLGRWVADCSTWEKFSREWAEALKRAPSITYFRHHEAKANPPSGEFKGWSRDLIDEKMESLVEVICRNSMYGAITGLRLKTHKREFAGSILTPKQLRSVLKLTDPYHHCFFSITSRIFQAEQERGSRDRRVDFVFDRQEGQFEVCQKIYRELKVALPPRIKEIAGSVTEGNSKVIAGLQAADLLIGQMMRQFRLPVEDFFKRLVTCHKVGSTRAYLPDFEQIPDLVSRLNLTWSTKRLSERGQKANKRPKSK